MPVEWVESISQSGWKAWCAEPVSNIFPCRGLAGDIQGLVALRAGLREGMAASPLCDGNNFAHNVEKPIRICGALGVYQRKYGGCRRRA